MGAAWQGGAGEACDARRTDHIKAKLVTGKFFIERMLPETALHLQRIQAGAATVMELPAEAF